MSEIAATTIPKIILHGKNGPRLVEVSFPATFADLGVSYQRLGLFKEDPAVALAKALALDPEQKGVLQIPEVTTKMEAVISLRLQGLEIPRYVSFMRGVAQRCTLNDSRQCGLFKLAMGMELEHIHGHLSFWERHKGDAPLCRGYNPAAILKLLLLTAQGGSYTSANTKARDRLANWMMELLVKTKPELLRDAKLGSSNNLWWRWETSALDQLSSKFEALKVDNLVVREMQRHYGSRLT